MSEEEANTRHTPEKEGGKQRICVRFKRHTLVTLLKTTGGDNGGIYSQNFPIP